MDLHPQAQAILLLTVYFSRVTGEEPRPLSPTEWGRFARWLKEHEIAPEMLLRGEPARLLEGWTDRTVTVERVEKLLNRAGALGLAMEKWQRAGLWILIRADADYPGRLKKQLQALSPPVLFGCGNRRLLDQGGIAVIGSRHASPEDLVLTSRLGSQAALQGLSIISGGARGVDENAMVGALAQEGTVVGVLADNLLRAATSARFRPSLMNGNLALISPFNPEAGFDVGNAMARNKYIYCLADAAVVIAADKEQGGTWNGAVENLKHGWTPLWIKSHPDAHSGNAELVRRGARWLPDAPVELATLLIRETPPMVERTLDLVAEPAPPVPQREVAGQLVETADGVIDHLSFYQLFLRRLQALAAKTPATDQELLEQLDIGKPQLQEWLKRAMAEGQVKRLNKPVRYQWQAIRPEQNSFFAHS
jgi:predicted Rossmann fold nucleotide-binding protein DprA/Smf involved in DNA uptake